MTKERRQAAALICLFAVLYLTQMGRTLQYDEAFTVLSYTGNPFQALVMYTAPNNHLVHSLFVWISRSLFGDGLLALRLPAFAASLSGLWATYLLTYRLSTHGTALTAVIILGTCYGFFEYATNARGYSLTIALCLVVIYLVTFWDWRTVRLLFPASMALVMTLPSMLYFLIPIFVWLVAQRKPITRIMSGWMAVGILSGGIFYLPALAKGWAGDSVRQFGLPNVLCTFKEWSALASVTAAHGVLFLIAVFSLASLRRERVFWPISLALVGAIVFSVGQQIVLSKTFYGRNFMYLIGPLSVAAAFVLWRVGRYRLTITASAICLVAGIMTLPRLTSPTYIDEALSALKNLEVSDSDLLSVACCIDASIAYYFPNQYMNFQPGKTVRAFIVQTFDRAQDAFAPVQNLVRDCRTVIQRPYLSIYQCEVKP